ncbi:dihydroneopterin aldolase [Ponticaulis profundi]|uniref:7,8-dihydroneopterin aldolase n=1 Tax=Ponticaulis profundi TaxID=2665222 RepID=A0ABW1SCL6_9PROT
MTHSKVIIRNLRIHGFHGVKQAEKALGQKFEVDLVCELNGKIGVHDQMDETVCYGEICDLVCAVSEADVFNLIETLADRIASAIFEKFALISALEIEIRKPNAPVRHIVDYVGIAIRRERA